MFMKLLLLPEVKATRLADLFRMLSDPSRVRIIAVLLEQELNVGSLAEALGMSESAVSHQLSGLRQLRVVRSRRQGRRIFCSLDDAHVAEIFRMGLDHVDHG